MSVIYIVTAGEYSDYHICGVFSQKSLALTYKERKGSECSIEEYEVDREAEATRHVVYNARITKDSGKLLDESSRETFGIPEDDQQYKGFYDNVIWASSGKSAKHALKLAAELRQKILRKGKI